MNTLVATLKEDYGEYHPKWTQAVEERPVVGTKVGTDHGAPPTRAQPSPGYGDSRGTAPWTTMRSSLEGPDRQAGWGEGTSLGAYGQWTTSPPLGPSKA